MNKRKHSSPLALPREGSKHIGIYRVGEGRGVVDISSDEFNATNNIDGVIRIIKDEYTSIDPSLPFYTHFNLEFCGHRIGSTYALPRIIAQGHFRSHDDEVTPTLNFDNCYIATCTSVREHVPYRTLREKDFLYSMKHIKDPESLKKAILKRYQVSMPELSREQILKMGVAITTLRITGRMIPR